MSYTTRTGLTIIGTDPIRHNPPTGWHEAADGTITCPHRDLTVCPDCADTHPEAVNVSGAHFWIADPDERTELAAILTDV